MSSQSKLPRRKRRARIIFTIALILLAAPFVVLQGATLWFTAHRQEVKNDGIVTVTDSLGRKIKCYELLQPGADLNIVFIHGTPGSASAFSEQFANPFPGANLYALDRPGFGGSARGRRRPHLDEQADAVGAVLSLIKHGTTILVGHSYGGPIAMEAALKFTNQVAGVVLIGGSVDPAQEHILFIQRIGDLPLVQWLVPRWLRQCNRELITLRGDLLRMQKELPGLTVPVVMLHGAKDDLVPIANVGYLREQLSSAHKSELFHALIFPEYNHFIPWEHPDAVEAAIRELKQQLHQPARSTK